MNDYLIAIEGTPFPLRFMDRSSWKCTPYKRRIISEHNDIEGIHHIYESPHFRTEIQFSIGEHSLEKHAEIVSYFQKLSKVVVNYWNDHDCMYRQGLFRIDDPVFEHKKTFDNDIWYEATSIKMTEY